MNEKSSGTIEQALKAQANVRNDRFTPRKVEYNQRNQNPRGRGRGRYPMSQATRGNEGFQNKSSIQCHKCNKYGHYQYECKSHIQCHNISVTSMGTIVKNVVLKH